MKRLLIFLSMFLLVGQLSAQRYTPMPTWYDFSQARFGYLRLPLNSPTGSKDTAVIFYRKTDSSLQLWTGYQFITVGGNSTASSGASKIGNDIRLGRQLGSEEPGSELLYDTEIPLNNKSLLFVSRQIPSEPYTGISKNGIDIYGDNSAGVPARFRLNDLYGGGFSITRPPTGTTMSFGPSQFFVRGTDGSLIFTKTPGTLPTAFHTVDGPGAFLDTLTITTMGDADSSDRAASTAFAQRLAAAQRAALVGTLGLLYQSVSFSSLADFVNRGATASVSSGNIEFSGGANTFTQTIEVNKGTLLEQWHASAVFIPTEKTSTSYGFGLGIRSTNSSAVNITAKFDATSSANSGKLFIYGGSNTLLKTSDSALAFNVNDSIELHSERVVDSIFTWVINRTQKKSLAKLSYGYSFAPGTTTFTQNTGRFAIHSFGGTFKVSELTITSNTPTRPDILVIGDSKTAGYFASSPNDRWAVLLRKIFPNTVIQAGSADKITDAMARLDETLSIMAKQIILCIGVNDIRAGTDSNTIKSNYSSYVTALQAGGAKVYHLLSLKEASLNADWFNNYIIRTWPDEYIDSKIQYCSDCLADAVHPNNKGNTFPADALINSGKLQGVSSFEDNSLNSVLSKGSTSTIAPVIGTASRLGTTFGGSFSNPVFHGIANYPSIVLQSTNSSFGGGAIVAKSRSPMYRLNPAQFGDSAAMALVFHTYVSGGNAARQMVLFTADATGNLLTPFLVRQPDNDFNGSVSRWTVQASYNLHVGVALSGSSNWNSPSVFAVQNSGNPFKMFGVPSTTIDTTNWKPFYNNSTTGDSYRGAHTSFGMGTAGTDLGWSLSGLNWTLNVPNASATARGVVTTGAQTFGGVKSFADRVVITKGAGITPDVNNLLYLGRNEPGNFYPLFVIEDKTDDGYAQFGFWGKNRKYNVGVGNGPSNFFGVQDKWYVLDATSNKIRLSIDTDGTVEIPELLKAKGNVATRIRTVTSNTTIDKYDHTILIDCSSGNVTVTLPTSASSFYAGYGVCYVFKRVDNTGNTATVTITGSDTIDGGPSFTLAYNQPTTIQAAGGIAWYRLN